MQVWKNSLRKYELYKIDKRNKKVLFSSNEYGHKLLNFDKTNNSIEINGKTYFLTEENKEILNRKLLNFEQEDKCRNLSNSAKFKNYTIYYKMKNKEQYQFVCKLDDKSMIRIYNTSLKNFLVCFDVGSLMFDRDVCSGNIKEDFMPLYKSALKNGDAYVVHLIDYLSGTATNEGVEFLNEYEGNDYLFVDRNFYDTEDIPDIRNVKLNRFGSMFGWRISYELECKINEKYYKMKFFPSKTESVLWANCLQGTIEISQKLLEKIKVLTGETDENIRTRKLMQLGKFFYENKSKWTDEQEQKIASDLSKVSLKDLQRLPKHWLDKIDNVRLYDWLKYSGLQGDKEASDYVENVIKNRKGSAKNEKVNKQN